MVAIAPQAASELIFTSQTMLPLVSTQTEHANFTLPQAFVLHIDAIQVWKSGVGTVGMNLTGIPDISV